MTDTTVPPSSVPPSSVPPAAVESVPTAIPVTFSGARGEFARLLLRGAMLELVTLGFYRFWLATDMRRHLWSRTSVGGDSFEYLGTAKELLIGFLIALAILVPIYVAYFLVGLEAERLQAFASIPLVLFLYLFAQFAIYRARRYRLSRTVWRGVRFWMSGSGWDYAWRAGLWALFGSLTLGLASPWGQAALERHKMRHSHFGDLPGGFVGAGGALFRKVWWIWAATFGIIGLTVLLAMTVPSAAAAGILALLVFSPIAYAVYKAHEWRWWVAGIRFGEVGFDCKLPASALVGLYWKVIGWIILITFLMMCMWGAIVFASLVLAHGPNPTSEQFVEVMQRLTVIGPMMVVYVVAALVVSLVIRLYLRRDVWARVVSASIVLNIAAADDVAARGDIVNALGEGFADNFDVGGL